MPSREPRELSRARIGEHELAEGEVITLDGNEGLVYAGQVATVSVSDEALLARLRTLRKAASRSAHKTDKHQHPA